MFPPSERWGLSGCREPGDVEQSLSDDALLIKVDVRQLEITLRDLAEVIVERLAGTSVESVQRDLESSLLPAVSLESNPADLTPARDLQVGGVRRDDETFSRLTRAYHIVRLARGVYRRRSDEPLGQPRFRTPRLVQALEAQGGCELLPGGDSEAKSPGLTDQVPKRDIFVRAGRNRKPINSERRFLEIRSAPR